MKKICFVILHYAGYKYIDCQILSKKANDIDLNEVIYGNVTETHDILDNGYIRSSKQHCLTGGSLNLVFMAGDLCSV